MANGCITSMFKVSVDSNSNQVLQCSLVKSTRGCCIMLNLPEFTVFQTEILIQALEHIQICQEIWRALKSSGILFLVVSKKKKYCNI